MADDDFDNVTEECFTSTKSFWNFPCAHRQYRHDGNCHLIHGYSRSFHFVFGIKSFTKEGFAVDYGDLKELKAHLDHMYDHTLVFRIHLHYLYANRGLSPSDLIMYLH